MTFYCVGAALAKALELDQSLTQQQIDQLASLGCVDGNVSGLAARLQSQDGWFITSASEVKFSVDLDTVNVAQLLQDVQDENVSESLDLLTEIISNALAKAAENRAGWELYLFSFTSGRTDRATVTRILLDPMSAGKWKLGPLAVGKNTVDMSVAGWSVRILK